MDAAAAALLERCHPHVPTALLAHLWRLGVPFPPMTAERATGGFQHVLDVCGWSGELIEGGQYILFRCPPCQSRMYQPNTDRGIAHALRVARNHEPDCCSERAASGHPSVWPDRLDE